LVDSHLFKGNGRSSTLKFSPEEVIFLLELIDYSSFEDLVGLFIPGLKIKVIVL
jgi:hypothetical protein